MARIRQPVNWTKAYSECAQGNEYHLSVCLSVFICHEVREAYFRNLIK